MKVEVCRVNEETVDGRVLVSDGLTWIEPLPLYDIDGTDIGTVQNLRIESNRLVGDVDFELDDVFCITIDVSPAAASQDAVTGVVLIAGKIRSARISPDSRYPWKD